MGCLQWLIFGRSRFQTAANLASSTLAKILLSCSSFTFDLTFTHFHFCNLVVSLLVSQLCSYHITPFEIWLLKYWCHSFDFHFPHNSRISGRSFQNSHGYCFSRSTKFTRSISCATKTTLWFVSRMFYSSCLFKCLTLTFTAFYFHRSVKLTSPSEGCAADTIKINVKKMDSKQINCHLQSNKVILTQLYGLTIRVHAFQRVRHGFVICIAWSMILYRI